MQRGARINATNRGDDTPLHLAAAHGHRDIVHIVSTLYDKNRQILNIANKYVASEEDQSYVQYIILFSKT